MKPHLRLRDSVFENAPVSVADVAGTRLLMTLCLRSLFSMLAFLIVSGQPVLAQQNLQVRVVEVVWGFDGRVVVGQFMPLSILIDNLSDQPIEATARLRRVAGMVSEVGGVATQPVFLGPNSRRWVQFYPYISDRSASWHFDLQTEERVYTFDPMDQPRAVFDRNKGENDPEQSLPAVILDPPGLATRTPTTVKHMPAAIFPPYATATQGLYALFLDHVPDWEAPRQEALLSWLRSGGRLHLLLDSNHQMLRFSGVLSPLNEPFPEFSVGTGTVTRYDVQRAGLVIQLVVPAVTPPHLVEKVVEEAAFNQTTPFPQGMGTTRTIDDDEIFSWLRDLTQPDHSWPLIFLLSMCYVGLIFPGCWILSRQRTLHFLVTYGAIAGLAIVFSLLFLVIGQRGYGESTSLYTLAVARAEDTTHWNSLQYNTLFVTSGDRYLIEEQDRQTLLASGSDEERVDALITSGNSASFISRIPPFSSQALMSRRRLTADSWDLAVVSVVQTGDDLTEMNLTFNDKFPTGKGVQYFALHGRRVYTLAADLSRKQLSYANVSTDLKTFCTPATDADDGMMMGTPRGFVQSGPDDPLDDPAEECFQKSLPRLVARSLADDFVDDLSRFRLPEGRIRLLVYSPIPQEMELSVSAGVRRDGRVLFVREMPMQNEGAQGGMN